MLEAKVGILFLFLIKVYQVTTTNNYHPITPRFLRLLRAAFLLSLSQGLDPPAFADNPLAHSSPSSSLLPGEPVYGLV